MTSRKAGELVRRKSDTGSWKSTNNEAIVAAELPWGNLKVVQNMGVDFGILPAKFSAQSLLIEIISVFERKLTYVCNEEPLDKVLSKTLKRGEDAYVDNLLRTLNGVCETCLPSVLAAFLKWYEEQQRVPINETGEARDRIVKRTLGAGYLFCVVLIEILPQMHYHPSECEQSVNRILTTSFKQISYRDPAVFGINYNNSLIVAETFAEVIGVLSQSHFKLVQNTFFSLLNDLRKETPFTTNTIRQIISLLMGMKFFRIKTSQVYDFEMGVGFLDELGSYYLEVDLKQKDLKHALAGLLVEIMLPIAAQIRTEANIPALIAFVNRLYGPTYELVNKKQHKMAAYPLLTCLLCISQSKFFLDNWVQFLNLTLANLKNKDPKISRVALESLYRLLWVYIIRNNCEGNTATRTRLESICSSLFPRGNRSVIPRDAPLNIFVKIIHFIAQQKLDFAFREIIFDLLGCNRASRSISIYPERMNIGIRALMVIADGLQQKEGPPGMPRSMGPIASGTIQRTKKTYLTHPLTADLARSIGLEQYYLPCRKAFDGIIRTLDAQVGRPLMLISAQTKGKEPEDILVGDVKPKLDLFRTCIAAIPRLLPDPMPYQELIELLTRMCVHMDEELRSTAFQTLQNLMSECVDWREDIITTYLNFLTNQIQDTFPTLLESTVRFLLQLLIALKSAIQQEKKREQEGESNPTSARPTSAHSALSGLTANGKSPSDATSTSDYRSSTSNIASDLTPNTYSSAHSDGGSPNARLRLRPSNSPMVNALHSVEGFALVLLCQIRTPIKKISISLLKEVRNLLSVYTIKEHDSPVITVLDDATPYVLNKYIEHVPLSERQSWAQDFTSACEKICNLEPDNCLVNQDKGNEYMRWDPWACALSGYTEYQFLITKCPTAVNFAWPALFLRLNHCNQYVDPSNPQNENRASLLRSSKSKATASSICGESLSQESYLSLWQKYLVMCCALTPPNSQSLNTLNRSFSPSASLDLETIRSMTSSIRLTRAPSSNGAQLFQKLTSMIRWEHMTDMRDTVALGIGSLNPACFELFLEDLSQRGILREAQDKKVESNVRRRKRKDLLRLQLVRIIEVALFRRVLEFGSLVDNNGKLSPTLCTFVDSVRHNVQSDLDRDMMTLTSTRLHYAKTVTLIINSIPPDRRKSLIPDDVRQALFLLFFSWCGRTITAVDRRRDSDVGTYVEQNAVHAMCALLCCGPMFEVGGSLNDEDYPYRWLEALLASSNQTVQTICEETLSLVLHLNDHNTQLFEWVVQMCYTKSNLVSTRCFKALVMLFSQREFPCDFVCLFVLCQVFMDGEATVQESAVLLLQILRQHFLDDMFSSSGASLSDTNLAKSLEAVCKLEDDSVCPRPFAVNQGTISRQLSKAYPQLTMPIFSEVCSRMESARPTRQAAMLSFLLQWVANVELVDPTCEFGVDSNDTTEKEGSHGWGSAEATQLLLNNLLYITSKWSTDHNNEVAALWKCLATSYASNLPIILHYFFVMISLSPDTVIPVAKKICTYLLDATSDRLVSLLMNQLANTCDHFKMALLRSEMPPYYRWQPVQHEDVLTVDDDDEENDTTEEKKSQNQKTPDNDLDLSNNTGSPQQLPMPAYGGYYANLSSLLPPSTQPIFSLSRSNLALFLLADLIGMDPSCQIQWSDHAHTILQIAVIGLDSMRPLVCRHSRSAVLNLCLLYASGCKNLSNVATIILHNQMRALRNEVLEKYCSTYGCESENHKADESGESEENPLGSTPALHADACREKLLHSNEAFATRASLLLTIVTVLTDKVERPLWPHEEPTARCWKTESADQLACFVQHIAEFFLPFIPSLAATWTQYSVSLALSTSNRHIAGRSFQVTSSLCQSPTPYATSLLSRLAEHVGEFSEDTQSYITQMVLSLHNSVPYLVIRGDVSPSNYSSGHSRSISYTPALLQRIQTTSHQTKPDSTPSHSSATKKDTRHSMLIEGALETPAPLSRSKSATMLKMDASSTITDDDMNTLCLLLSSSVALLESHVDNEFLLSLALVDKLFTTAGSHIGRCLENLEKTVAQMDWTGFPGIVGLASKGTLYANGYESTVSLLVKCIGHLEHSAVATSPSNAFSLIVVSTLPCCLVNFESPTDQCCNAAQVIAEYCMKKLPDALKDVPELSEADHPLHNLATMMNQYRERGFQRDRFQWAKCVVNYLVEAFSPNIVQLVVFLSEMLERCQPSLHVYLLHMIYLFVGHSRADLKDSSPVPLNAQVIRVVLKHVQGVNWREAARIFKSFVDQWSTISITQVPQNELCSDQRKPNFELYVEKEALSGSNSPQTPRKAGGNGQPTTNVDSLKRQTNPSQSKVRERLVRLLTASGLQVGLPRSSSAVFVQSINDVRQDADEAGNNTAATSTLPIASTSAFSSTERISHQDDYDTMSGSSLAAPGEQSSITTDSFPRVFKEFDFLEAEHDSISESTESCFNWLSTMRQPRCSDENAEEEVDDALTDELEDDFIHPDDGDLSEQSHGARLRSTVAQRGLTGFMGRGRRPLSAASDSNDISSDRTPIQSEKHSDESCPSCPASDEEYDEESDRKSHAESRPVASTPDDASSTRDTAGEDNNTYGETTTYANAETASSVQCRSEFSVRHGSSELINKPPIYLECSHHTSGRVEHAWMSYVTDIANDQDGELTAHSVLLLSQLLRESSSKLSGLLRDASHLLTTPTTPQTARSRDIATYFTHALHAAMRVTDCPFVFVTAQFLRHSNLLQSEKFCLYELREHFETFSERREQCIRALNTVKSAQRFLSLNASPSPGLSTSSHEVELCKALHKLFFQLHQMLEKLLEMIRSIQQATNAGEYDLSPAVISLQRDLLTCLSEVPPSESRTSSTSLNASRSDLQTDSLVLHLTNKNYKSALVTLRQLRGQYGSEFGCCDHMDLEMLLLQFCRSHSLRTWAIVGSIQSLEQSVQSVKETNMQLAALVHSLVADANMSRLSRMSSVNDASSFNTVGSSSANQYT